jgi:hypothetical protein
MVSWLPGPAIDGAQVTLSAVLGKARFWERVKNVQLNDRQRLHAVLIQNPEGGRSTSYSLAPIALTPTETVA